MEELGRDYGTTHKHYACDCCGRWIPQGSYAVVIAYRTPAHMLEELGNYNLIFEWHCLECGGEMAA